MKKSVIQPLCLFVLFFTVSSLQAQMITGVWKGRVGSGLRPVKVELKLVQKGDSLTGSSYYYESAGSYRRYAVKGYFNQQRNTVVWWDEELLEEKAPRVRVLSPGEIPLLSEADFNCPGGGVMMLDGKAVSKDDQKDKGPLHFDKTEQPLFRDEWDYIIENYTVGGNDPDLIDSVAQIGRRKPQPVLVTAPPAPAPPAVPEVVTAPPAKEKPVVVKENKPVVQDSIPALATTETQPVAPKETPQPVIAAQVPPIKEKFLERKKVFTTELPLDGDTIELHFYDNAEIDGDSISLFLNNTLVFEHVRLSDKPYVVKFAVTELNETNELVMVAENLGAIPPNTSYMIAYVKGVRYTANLESTENSSAMIRFVRKKE